MVAFMRITPLAAIVIVVLAGLSAFPAAQERPATQVISTYCAGCHNGVMRSPSGALLDQFDPARIAEDPDAWTRA